jgi:hypothetical protein
MLLPRKVRGHLETSNCSRLQSPLRKVRANPHAPLVKGNPHKAVRANPRAPLVKGNPHKAVRANPRAPLVKGNRQTPPGYLLKKLHLNRGSRCSNDGYAH